MTPGVSFKERDEGLGLGILRPLNGKNLSSWWAFGLYLSSHVKLKHEDSLMAAYGIFFPRGETEGIKVGYRIQVYRLDGGTHERSLEDGWEKMTKQFETGT